MLQGIQELNWVVLLASQKILSAKSYRAAELGIPPGAVSWFCGLTERTARRIIDGWAGPLFHIRTDAKLWSVIEMCQRGTGVPDPSQIGARRISDVPLEEINFDLLHAAREAVRQDRVRATWELALGERADAIENISPFCIRKVARELAVPVWRFRSAKLEFWDALRNYGNGKRAAVLEALALLGESRHE